MGRHNHPPCLRNQLPPKSVHLALGVLGVSDVVPVYLKGLDAGEGLILKSRIDLEGRSEVASLIVEPLLASICVVIARTAFCAAWRSCNKSDPAVGGRVAINFEAGDM